jgi:F-type H+-transporting ATPase subunit a
MMRIGQPDARLCKTHALDLAVLATKSRGDRLTARRDRFLAHGHAARHSRVIAPHEGWQASRNDQANVEHTLSQQAVAIATPFGFPITNSMVVTWIVTVALVVFAQLATRHMERVPHGAQNFLEWIVEGLYRFLEGVIGPHLTARTFWYFASVFIFILSANWFGLIPGVGSVGWGHMAEGHIVIDRPLLRGANADVNLTLAMALIFFACWIVWAVQEDGVRGVFAELFAPKGSSTGALKFVLAAVFFASGCLEIISILFRPVSLSFRLYGNIFAGETMLETMARMPRIGWLVQIPFYFLELLVGLVQALVFMLLTAVFTLLICQPHEKGTAT